MTDANGEEGRDTLNEASEKMTPREKRWKMRVKLRKV